MEQFLAIAFSLPTVVFTILLILVVLYWLSVIVGALDIDLFGADGLAEGAADGVADGVADGIADGLADGVADGIADGVADGIADGVADGIADGVADGVADGIAEGVADGAADGAAEGLELDGGEGFLAAFFSSLNLRKAPVTVVFSLLVLYAWIVSYFGLLFLPQLVAGVPGLVWSVAVPLVAMTFSLLATAVSIKPIAPMFEVHTSRAQETIVGQEVVIHTLSVDERHGQAYYKDGGADLLLKVRCQSKNDLTKGSRALVIDYNKQDHVYFVEPMDQLLGEDEGRGQPSSDAMRQLERELAQHQVHQQK